MKIEYHKARLPDEDPIYEVKVYASAGHPKSYYGSIYFVEGDDSFEYVDNCLKEGKDLSIYIEPAAVKLIEDEGARKVTGADGNIIAELQTHGI